MMAAEAAVASLRAQPILPPSQIMPVRLALMLMMAVPICLSSAPQEPHHGGGSGGGGGHAAAAGGAELAGEQLDVDVEQVGEGQGLHGGLPAGAQVPGHLHHGDDGGDAVVAAAGAAHHRVGAAGHAPLGAGGHPHHGAGHQAAAHDVGGQVGLEGVGDADAQAVLQAVVGEGLVHLRALQHKGQLLLAGGVRQLPELGDGHGLELGVKRVLAAGGVLLLKEHLVVGAGVDDVGVGVPDGADADAPGGDDLGVGVELALPLGDGHAHLLVLHQTDGLLADDAVDLLQQLQPFSGLPAGTDGGGVLQVPPRLEAGGKLGPCHRLHAVLVDAGG